MVRRVRWSQFYEVGGRPVTEPNVTFICTYWSEEFSAANGVLADTLDCYPVKESQGSAEITWVRVCR